MLLINFRLWIILFSLAVMRVVNIVDDKNRPLQQSVYTCEKGFNILL